MPNEVMQKSGFDSHRGGPKVLQLQPARERFQNGKLDHGSKNSDEVELEPAPKHVY
jgi:hypothetical protein